MTGKLRFRGGDIVSEKQAAGNWEPCIADHVRVACVSGEPSPVHQVQLTFGAVDDGFIKGDRITDGGIQKLIVVGIVPHVAPVDVHIKAELFRESLGHSTFEVVAVGGLHGEAKETRIKRRHLRGAGEQDVFEDGRLEDTIVSHVKNQIVLGKGAAKRYAGAESILIEQKLVMIPAKTRADGPLIEMNFIFNECRLL